MSPIEELLRTWRSNPNAPLTIALCSELARTGRGEVAREIGATAETWHAQDLEVMLAVGRMYFACELFTEAQTALVTAGKLDPEDERSFRLLGRTLLRRGDAVRAERVLSRAQMLGAGDDETGALVAQVPALVALQKRSGMQAVANQAKRLLSSRPPASPVPIRGPGGGQSDKLPLPRFETEDPIEISEVYERETAPGGQGVRPRVAAAARAPKAPAAGASKAAPLQGRPRIPSGDEITDVMGDGLARLEEMSIMEVSRAHARRGGGGMTAPSVPPGRSAPAPAIQSPPSRAPAAAVRAGAPSARPQPSYEKASRGPEPAPQRSVAPAAPRSPAPAPASFRATYEPEEETRTRSGFDESVEPPPALVFEHLARVGIFEPSGGAPPAWEAAPRQKSRGVIPLLVASLLLAGAGVGGYEYALRVKADRAQQATALNAEVAKLLHTARVSDLRATDAKLSRAFDLDSRSQVSGRLWLENRVLGALLLPDEPIGIDSAVHRGRTVGLPEKDLAVGRIASFLAEGDLAGATAQLPKWDGASGKDAVYQVAAGAALERAGDPRAVERYTAARTLDPKLLVADILLARLLLLEYGPERARAVIDELAQKGAEPLAVRALSALVWVVDLERSPKPPDDVRLTEEEAKQLSAPLAAIPSVVDAVEAMVAGDQARASTALDQAISLSHGPALPTTLGFLAIQVGNEALARKAALRALSFAALYPRARTLAARVALLGGRLDEAQKAVEELDPQSADVAVVRAVVAYETGEISDLDTALGALGDAAKTPAFAALSVAPGVLAGTRFPDPKALGDLASPAVPWGRLIALDAALDTGNLKAAAELVAAHGEPVSPVELLRVARLCRYEKKLDRALAASEGAFAGKPTAALIIERTYELIETDKVPEAKELVAKYPALLGPTSAWLGVLLDVASNQVPKAVVRLTKLEPPPDEAPTFQRLLVARALAVASDKRAKPYVFRLAKRIPRHPDVLFAAEALR